MARRLVVDDKILDMADVSVLLADVMPVTPSCCRDEDPRFAHDEMLPTIDHARA